MVTQEKDLGVLIDSDLHFENHILEKIRYAIGLLASLNKTLRIRTSKVLCNCKKLWLEVIWNMLRLKKKFTVHDNCFMQMVSTFYYRLINCCMRVQSVTDFLYWQPDSQTEFLNFDIWEARLNILLKLVRLTLNK